MYLADRAEVDAALRTEYDATASQVAEVMAYVYLFRTIAVAFPIVALIVLLPSLHDARPLFFGVLLVLLVLLVAYQVLSGTVGSIQAMRGRGDPAFATFLVMFLGLTWALPRPGTRTQD